MKLDDINKKNIYTVPDKYFDKLPTKIQARVSKEASPPWFSLDWKLLYKVAAPALVIIVMVFYFGGFNQQERASAEELLAGVGTEDMIAYLEYTDISTDELIESIDFSDIELDFYQDGPIMQDMGDIENDLLYDEYGLEELL